MQSMQKNLTVGLLSLNHDANRSYILYTAINFHDILIIMNCIRICRLII